ncbi:ATP-binding protein [Enterovibrio norvegicus]|uniref:Sensory/regulatory protein RpfC n=1 Tax=Enterovibrio norvegicus TaxID=188144 RepID=A0A2N7L484_9GAMM|nr:ATP-binding protein [Enterovibrio norvegicus]PMN88188.1 hybrid sensor histidine kinase/response regulator [Enterovibrio norvegicus]
MTDQNIQRANQFPFSKSIVGKVGLIMAAMTLTAMLLSVSTYVMHDNASTDTTNTSRLEIPSALLSVSMLRYAGEMNRSMLSYALGSSASLDTYYRNKNQFEVSLEELKKIHGTESGNLQRIEDVYQSLYQQIRTEVIEQYNPKRETWALDEKRYISTTIVTELDRKISALASQDDTNGGLSEEDRQHYLWLLREQTDDMRSSLFFYLSGEAFKRERFERNKQSFQEYLALLQANAGSTGEKEKLQDISIIYQAFYSRIESVFDSYNPYSKQQAIASLKIISTEEYKVLETALTEFSRETSFRAANSMASLHKVLKTNQLSFFALFGVMTLVSIVLTVYIYKRVTQPIARLADTMLKLSDGNTEIPILYKERPDEVGQISHALSSFRDHIISRNQAREQLLYQKERAESASKAKAQFLAAMSHEIRTPMNGVIGMIDILRRSNLDSTQKGVANTVRESALSLLSIINDILDFSRIEAGKMRIDEVPLSIRHITEQVMDNLTTEANEKNVSLMLFVDPLVPSSLLGDPTRIKQILFNLIGNGIKFSGGQPHVGEVQIWIKSSTDIINDKGKSVVPISIEIKDNGIGISPDKLESIFRPFTQAEYSTTRRYGGSGLGLAISKNIISLLGGSIDARSEEGIGSTFYVDISLPHSNTINVPDDSNMLLLTEAAKTLSNVVCLNTLENGPLKTSIDSYLDNMNIRSQTVSLDMLHQHKLAGSNKDTKFVIICRDYMQAKQLTAPFITASNNIRYLELDMSLPVHRYEGKDVFAIYASPMKLSMLLSGLRICIGLESPDYPVVDTSGREAFIERVSEHRGTVLVAEDNITNQTVIEKQLTYLGYKVVMTADGQDALRAYRQQPFTLVITDCHMPNMDGYELTRSIRVIQKERNEFVPIIALTANALVGEAERCIETGMNDFIAKPVEMDVIQKVLNKWRLQSRPTDEHLSMANSDSYVDGGLSQTPSDTSHADQAEQQAHATQQTPSNHQTSTASTHMTSSNDTQPQNIAPMELDPSVLKKLFWGDKATYDEVLGEFQKHCIPELQEMANALPPYDYNTLKDTAHKLKTSSRSIGARDLSDTCKSLEIAASEQNGDVEELLKKMGAQLLACTDAVNVKREFLAAELQQDKIKAS